MAVPFRIDTEHPFPDGTVGGGYALVLSNLILLVVFYRLLRAGRWDVGMAVLASMVTSIIYHSCRAGFVCEIRYRDHQVLDHLFVHALMIVVASELAVRRELFDQHELRAAYEVVAYTRTAFFFAIFPFSAMLVVNNVGSVWVSVIGFGVPFAAIVLSAILTRTPLFRRPRYGYPGTLLSVLGVICFGFFPFRYYEYTHTLWHFFSMIGIYLVFLGGQTEH